MTNLTDRARFAHWIDLHHMVCGKVTCQLCSNEHFDSDTLWQELDTLEEIRKEIPALPPMPEMGAHVYVQCGDAVLSGNVSYVYPNREQFVVNTQTGHRYCTLADLVHGSVHPD